MHMNDWSTYRQQLSEGVAGLAKLSPDAVKGYVTLSGASQRTGHIDAKTRELIARYLNGRGFRVTSLRCDGCIAVHSAAARKNGATREEVAEALTIAISINAGAALVYSTRALDAFDTE